MLKRLRRLRREKRYRERIEACRWGFNEVNGQWLSETEILEAMDEMGKIAPALARASSISIHDLEINLRKMVTE